MSQERIKGRGPQLVNILQGALAHPPVRESDWAAYKTQKSPLLQ